MIGTRANINGIMCRVTPVGGGMYAAVPEDLAGALKAVLSGQLKMENLLGEGLNIEWISDEAAAPVAAPVVTPTPKATKKETVAEYRTRKGLSQRELSEQLGVARSTVSRWEAQGRAISAVMK